MLDKFICQFRGVGFILSLLFYVSWKILLANNVGSDHTPHYVASDLGLHCLPMTHVASDMGPHCLHMTLLRISR